MQTLPLGYHALVDAAGPMGMDIGVLSMAAGESAVFQEKENESAFLLLSGRIALDWETGAADVSRRSVFEDPCACLHVPAGVRVSLRAGSETEVLVQRTRNRGRFPPVFYAPGTVKRVVLGGQGMDLCARRLLWDIFNFENAPYSNMVLGELITLPGRWSSYPPHHHPQPEVYYYKFDRPQGFGVSLIGDSARIVRNNDISEIPGGLCHPQVAAPGYAMYYCWMIRHLENDPWTSRVDNPDHAWLHDPGAPIWSGADTL